MIRGKSLVTSVLIKLVVGSIGAMSLLACNPESLQPLDQIPTASAPDTVTVKIKNYRPKTGNLYKQIFVSNYSVKASQGKLTYSTARDGLSDSLKTANNFAYGSLPASAHSAHEFFSDLMLYLSGIKTPQQPYLNCPSSFTLSTSNDAIIYADERQAGNPQEFLGLRDCEKSYLSLDKTKFDYDNDGIPDYLELRCGMNPRNGGDANLAVSGDGVTNLEKCKKGIPVDENANSQPNQLFAAQYLEKLQPDGSTDFTVSNIPVLFQGAGNLLVFSIIEIDTGSLQSTLYTAFAKLPAASSGRSFEFNFWGIDSAHANNQEILF